MHTIENLSVIRRKLVERTCFCFGCIFSNNYYLTKQKSQELKYIFSFLMKLWILHVSCWYILLKAIFHKKFRFVAYKEDLL